MSCGYTEKEPDLNFKMIYFCRPMYVIEIQSYYYLCLYLDDIRVLHFEETTKQEIYIIETNLINLN